MTCLIWGKTRMFSNVYWPCGTSWGLFLLAWQHFWEFLLAGGQWFTVSVEPCQCIFTETYWFIIPLWSTLQTHLLYSLVFWRVAWDRPLFATVWHCRVYHACCAWRRLVDCWAPLPSIVIKTARDDDMIMIRNDNMVSKISKKFSWKAKRIASGFLIATSI